MMLAANTHLKLPDRTVNGTRFLTGGVFDCDIVHRRSEAILCILYKIRCNPMHPLNGALPAPYLPVRVTRGAICSHIGILMCRLVSEPRSTTGLLFPSQCPSGTTLLTPSSIVWDWWVSRAGPMLFLLA